MKNIVFNYHKKTKKMIKLITLFLTLANVLSTVPSEDWTPNSNSSPFLPLLTDMASSGGTTGSSTFVELKG